jgi:predicted patatin/cPLA2 family phospholipase
MFIAVHGRLLCVAAMAAAVVLLAACSTPQRLPPVPAVDTSRAQPLGIPNARFSPYVPEPMIVEATAAAKRRLVAQGLMQPDGPLPKQLPPVEFLAVSGGGDDGAFGAGLLVGWTEHGDRPEFQLVTGVSTGALIAPYAYLGSSYDAKLREVYTTISPDKIYEERGLFGIYYGDSMADTTPLWEMISSHVDEQMLVDLARAYEGGRLLLIGTTNLDAQVPVLWNIGAIAASGHPDALDLVRKILRASSAVPGVFQPVLFDIELDGKHYQELHVDGGAIAQMFLYPPTIDVRQQVHRERTAYLIRNARQDLRWADVEPRTFSIAGRAISTMIHSSGTNDIARIYFVTQRDGVDYNLAYIGSDFDAPHPTDFDMAYMNSLFDYAYQQGRAGYDWKKAPPGLIHAAQN